MTRKEADDLLAEIEEMARRLNCRLVPNRRWVENLTRAQERLDDGAPNGEFSKALRETPYAR